ncbi:hypothetical protein GPALN_004213 [Globodera pallida]|nr:hypothetical protein GPALN_004213 [Globodera pallida]
MLNCLRDAPKTSLVCNSLSTKVATNASLAILGSCAAKECRRPKGDGPEDTNADRPETPGHSPGVVQPIVAVIKQLPATSTTTDTAASNSEVTFLLQRFVALMVLESRQHGENVKEECRRHKQEMERLLVQYGQETTRKK